MFKILTVKISTIPRDLRLFFMTLFLAGLGGSIVDAVFNNFLNDKFKLSGLQRSFIEFPRELPGFLVVFVSALLFFMYSRRLAVLTFILQAIGLLLVGFFSINFSLTMCWLFIFSLGQHLFMPLNSSIAMELANKDEMGKRLGQSNGIRNLAVILGSMTVFLGFKYFNFNFPIAFSLAALCFIIAAIIMYNMNKGEKNVVSEHLSLHKEYRLYYWLCVLFGTRKQIFLTFAPWVLVTVYHKSTQTIALLLFIGAIVGVIFQPWLGRAIDKLGEKKVLAAEAILLVFVCTGYGLAKDFFEYDVAFIIASVCYIVDQMLMSVGMARSTYLRKIALDPRHVKPTLAMAISIDHIFSISVAIIGGLLWSKIDYKWVFLLGGLISLINLFSVLRIKIEKT